MRKVTNGVTDKAREEFWPDLPDPSELLKNGNPMHEIEVSVTTSTRTEFKV
jgi:hypothetical protein